MIIIDRLVESKFNQSILMWLLIIRMMKQGDVNA